MRLGSTDRPRLQKLADLSPCPTAIAVRSWDFRPRGRKFLIPTVISGLRWYAFDQYGLPITVGGVGGDFSQTALVTDNMAETHHQFIETFTRSIHPTLIKKQK